MVNINQKLTEELGVKKWQVEVAGKINRMREIQFHLFRVIEKKRQKFAK